MKTFEGQSALLPTLASSMGDLSATSFTNTPVSSLQKARWWPGWACVLALVLGNVYGFASGHGPALSILSLPVLIFLYEGFQQCQWEQLATRNCAVEAFAKGALLGPPILAVAEAVGGVLLALVCFGRDMFEAIVVSATENPMGQPFTFSTRLFREALRMDPAGAMAFALLSSLIIVGLCEEAFKIGIGAWQVTRYKPHKRTLNPVIVMAGVGLGLAYSESIVAVSSLSGTSAAKVAAERVLTSFPVHVACAVWTAKRASWSMTWLGALFPAALSHGVFDFGIIMATNFSTRIMGLGWSFAAAAMTSFAGHMEQSQL